MANSPQARKRVRQSIVRTDRNKARRSRIRTYIKQVETAIAAGDQSKAEDALKTAQPEIMRGVSKGVMHKNTAARKISRLNRRIRALSS